MTSQLTEKATQALPESLFRHWIHSREEDAEGAEVYRPEGFPFPPSFGRDGFVIRQNGRFIQELIGPADAIVRVPGHWKQVGSRSVVVDLNSPDHRDFEIEILQLDASVLRLRRRFVQRPRHTQERVPDAKELKAFQAQPAPSMIRLIDFTDAQVGTLESFPPQHILRVSGTKPYANMDVELVPLVYVRQPEYWEIEVVGTLRGIGLPALAPFSVSLRLAGTLGISGIEVVGASERERFDIAPVESSERSPELR